MKKWRIIPVVVFAMCCFFLWRGLSLEPQRLPSARLGQPFPPMHLPVLGTVKQYFTTAQLQGHVSLLNVWASWCTSCAEEQLFLMKLKEQGLLIFGLNYKDDSKDAKTWLAEWGNPYYQVAIDHSGSAAVDLGVYGTPETFLIDAHGVIQYRYAGPLNEGVWNKEFLPRIRSLKEAA